MDDSGENKPINADFLGGPPKDFDRAGREQLGALLDYGLVPTSTVCDFGCGCLRGGKWIVPLIDAGNYCGIEPMEHMVEKGIAEFLTPEMNGLKRPRFDHNDRFDCGVFAPITFTHFIARSIWSHACKRQICQMLDSVAAHGTDDCVFLASFRPSLPFGYDDYKGDEWVGRSHECGEGGMIKHSMGWIRRACKERGLRAERVKHRVVVNHQPWCLIRRG